MVASHISPIILSRAAPPSGGTQGKVTGYFVKLSFQEEKSCLYSQPKVSSIISCGSFGTFSNIAGTLQRQKPNGRFSSLALSLPRFPEGSFLLL